jgi:GDPmannose 4,6-dehydratase
MRATMWKLCGPCYSSMSPTTTSWPLGRAIRCWIFVRMAFALVGLDPDKYVVSDPELYRPGEVHMLLGNPAKARAKLGWRPRTDFEGLLREMVASDCASL